MLKLRVQEHNVISGKNKLSHLGYDDIKNAYKELRRRAIFCHNHCAYYDTATDAIKNDAIITTNRKDMVVVRNGRAVREFTLVVGRGTEPVPFGHLLRKE